ncbi:hypothetical protein EJ02DRAFT_451829 [Clathrospora elynae]|uniref:Uncharacterized protein n=1 Tax=Clathrospora elynae TaxID=706981 RepID=A0A6A5SZ92_9PLEO|nr:hypothetical protein EJ02DRAFT_451829 [Clathrospora elynae]
MGIFTPFTSPRDPRWQGAQHHHHTIFLAKNAILLFIIVVIIENILLKIWAADSYYEYKDEDTGP